MAKEYIEREAFISRYRELYCKECSRRRGKKNGKMQVLYEIGEAPCRACDIDDMLDAVDDWPTADVREVVLCKECYLHTHCRTEDVFHFSELDEENRFCSVGKRKINSAQMMDVPDTDVVKFAKDTNVPSKSVTTQNRLTNADRIRAMSDEELAVWHEQYCPNRDDIDKECQKESCEMCWLDWLKQEVEE